MFDAVILVMNIYLYVWMNIKIKALKNKEREREKELLEIYKYEESQIRSNLYSTELKKEKNRKKYENENKCARSSPPIKNSNFSLLFLLLSL